MSAADDAEELLAASDETGRVPSTVKLKLNTLLRDDGGNRQSISAALNVLVLESSKLVWEGYVFGNFHITRLLKAEGTIPKIDRNFFYRCLLSIGKNNCLETTLAADWAESVRQFDAFRPRGYVKASVIGRVQLVADLSIIMATMATNHLWMNLESRLTTYLRWKYPNMSKSSQKSVVVALVKAPKAPLDEVFKPVALPKIFTSRAVKSAKAKLLEATKACKEAGGNASRTRVQKARDKLKQTKASTVTRITAEVAARNVAIQHAKGVAAELKAVMHLPSAGQFASQAHLTLPLYSKILRETIDAKNAWEAIPEEATDAGKRKKNFKGKTFTLLPCKGGFTLSYIPISSMTMLQVLKDLKLMNFAHDGRDEDKHAMWSRFFNLNAVETRTRRFADRIVTDGYGVSVLMTKPACSCCKAESEGGFSKCREHVEEKPDGTLGWKPNVLIGAVDPGLTDVATTAYVGGKKKTHSYSSSRYYQKALIHTSNRRTAKWNKDTEELVRDAPSCETTLVKYICHYLSVLDRMLAHRASKGYRAMRFLRYVKKKEAVEEIVELIAPKENVVILGFGDWKGPGKTPISRKTCGPLQDIKYALSKRKNVVMEEIDEYGSSKHCSCCRSVLTNMRAKRTTHKKQPDGTVKISTQRGRVHKILHCRSSTNGLGGHCGASWDRDVNASRNLLELTQCQIFGMQRPSVFCRKKTTWSPSGANSAAFGGLGTKGANTVCEARQVTKNSVMGDLKHLFVKNENAHLCNH